MKNLKETSINIIKTIVLKAKSLTNNTIVEHNQLSDLYCYAEQPYIQHKKQIEE